MHESKLICPSFLALWIIVRVSEIQDRTAWNLFLEHYYKGAQVFPRCYELQKAENLISNVKKYFSDRTTVRSAPRWEPARSYSL